VVRARSFQEPEPLSAGGRGEARVDVELAEDVRHVRRDGLLADEEPVGDLAVGESVGEQPEHLDLSRREPGAVVAWWGTLGAVEVEPRAAGEFPRALGERPGAERRGTGRR
jgi:hypothetical protein